MLPAFPLLLQALTFAPSVLRWDLLSTTIGAVLLFIGFIAVTLFLLRRKSRDFTLFYFGIFSILYAVRLLATTSTVQVLLHISAALCGHIDRVITYVIIVPFTLFLMQVVSERLRTILRYLLVFQAVVSTRG